MTYDEPIHTLDCTFLRETEKAVLIETPSETLWIPLSQVKEIHRSPDGQGRIVVTAWLAKKKGLI